ncbi:MAG: hydroxymyristoyl-ACP dehydratase [Steroidobacter sp.]
MDYEITLRIAANHPSLAGHFPGQPIVPGVLLLDLVIEHAGQWLGRTLVVSALPQAKFTSPLLPEQDAQLRLSVRDHELRFAISRDGAAIAQGMFRLAAGHAA